MNQTLRFPTLSRRQFGKLMGATGLALSVSPGAIGTAFADGAPDSSTIIKGKVSGMLVHNAKLGVMETPIALLREHQYTPKEILEASQLKAVSTYREKHSLPPSLLLRLKLRIHQPRTDL